MKKQFLASTWHSKNSDKIKNVKEPTTQFSVSKKRDIPTRIEIGMYTAAKILGFNGASFEDFMTTEEASSAVECFVEQNSKKFKFDKNTEDSPFAQLVKHRYTHTWSLIASDSVLTSNLVRLVPRPPLWSLHERAIGQRRWQPAQGLRCVSVCTARFTYH